CMQALEFPITF
nr:immunoglobulin light chain junction region [Macaca mulatta]MOW40681.1 immunoglobulin light chain junction region [Macaca mulatta]MOW40712.1 immunoglobulin light chain junction region [Macaca mulatta]MOW40716.1 immunoglobulin light chain junction region [Macaca mulatta]MOW40779.1 immunoglobulin light chain junction region [Macaca mulatta]